MPTAVPINAAEIAVETIEPANVRRRLAGGSSTLIEIVVNGRLISLRKIKATKNNRESKKREQKLEEKEEKKQLVVVVEGEVVE
jgi:hypothetical protein